MDLNAIEATSVAIRAGQVAAAELCALLTREDDEPSAPIVDWFDPQLAAGAEIDQDMADRLQIKVERLGGYVCHSAEPVSGERLYRWAVHETIVRRGEWGDQPYARRQSFELFALTTRAAYTPLKAEQARLTAAGVEEPGQLGLALEDSIFEPEETLGQLSPEAIAAAKLIAEYDSTAPQRAAEAAARTAADAELGPDPADQEEAEIGPLSIGEAPARKPRNAGGRPKRPKAR